MNTKYIGWMMAGLLVAGCAGDKGSTGPAGPQGQTGAPGPGPSVSWVSPAPASTSIALDSVVRAGFSTAMDASTLNASTVQVSAGGVPITGTISYNAGSQTVYFSPGLPLTAFTAISAVLTTGVKDAGGTALAGTYSWSFTTGGSFAPARLYISEWVGSSVIVFNNAGAATGNISPDRILSGATTTISNAESMWLDKAADRLYVTKNITAPIGLLVFNNASTANGNIAPSRTITAASFQRVYSPWLDAASDTMYTVDPNANAVNVINNISTASGTVVPDRVISGGNTTFNFPSAIWLDKTTDQLYVCNFLDSSILVFSNASTMNGNVSPGRVITSSTTLNGPFTMWFDSASNSLYVVSRNTTSILVYSNASTINGYVVPSRTISGGATLLSNIGNLWLDTATDRLYVTNESANRVLVFNSASTINGNVAPSRNISGANTTFNGPIGIWLDSD